MKHRFPLIGIAILLGGLALLSTGNFLEGREQAGGKTVKMKLLLPVGEDVLIKIDGKEVEGNGDVRTLTATTGKDKDYVVVTAFWEPNNYTKITRPRKVTASNDEVTVDFRSPSNTEKDDIVVRYVPTPDKVVAAMCKMAKVGKDDVVYDLGCGDGRMVIMAVKDFGAKKGVGVDLREDLITECKESAKKAGVADKVTFRVGDVLKVEDLSDATVVLLYMGDDINARLKPILQKTLKPGSRVVSHRFLMGDDWKPNVSDVVRDTEYGDCEIHMWTIGEKKK
jgi:SAM-dependent methyltransferase